MVGDGDDRARLETFTNTLGIAGNVRFHGAVDDAQLQSLLSNAHVFVMPSKKEGFGIVFLEAMAAGLPCIGANHGGTPEVVEHGKSGFLIEYGDHQKLAFYLRALAESPELYRGISEGASYRATNTFALTSMAAKWKSLLRLTRERTAPSANAESFAAAADGN